MHVLEPPKALRSQEPRGIHSKACAHNGTKAQSITCIWPRTKNIPTGLVHLMCTTVDGTTHDGEQVLKDQET
jgi:hypothetical protein